MKPLLLFALLILGCSSGLSAQASFSNNGSGNWDNPSTWTLVDGSTSTNYPVAGDTVTLNNADTVIIDVNSQCANLTIKGGGVLLMNSTSSILTVSNAMSVSGLSSVSLNPGVLTVTGTMTVSGASTVTVDQGALTVVGLMALTSPTSPAGTTLLDVEGGAFSCAGGMTITATTVPAGRYAVLQIGNSAVQLVGGLATVSANAKVTFTGAGALTLAGSINMANPGSFTAGVGKVVYLNIPGADQTVAPLSYYRLVIAGLGTGAGVKNINGAVNVADSLTLLTDTLTVNSPGTLTLSSNATIVRTGGVMTYAPLFAGNINLVYNGLSEDTTGPELPTAPAVLQNLTISNPFGVQLGAPATVNDTLNLQQGPLITAAYALSVTNPAGGAVSDPAVTRTNGYVVGTIRRNIGASAGLRIFPLGVGGNYRELDLNYTTAPVSGGLLSVQVVDTPAPAQSGIPFSDGTELIANTEGLYWEADTSQGLSGGLFSLTLTDGGATGVSDLSTLRIINRSSAGSPWMADGTEGTNTGTTAAPVVVRTGMSDFTQFTLGSDNTNPLPVGVLFVAAAVTNNDVLLNWSASGESGIQSFAVEYSSDGSGFYQIGTVEALAASTQTGQYSFTQTGVSPGPAYYRLRQMSADGVFTYSEVVEVYIKAGAGLQAYPNPSAGSITVATAVSLFNASGQYVQTLHAGTNNISQLPNGLYFARTQNDITKIIKE